MHVELALAVDVTVQDPVLCVKPEPEKVIVDPTEPELELNVTVGVGVVTVNGNDIAGDPDSSVKVTVYVFAATLATTKLPLIVPLLA